MKCFSIALFPVTLAGLLLLMVALSGHHTPDPTLARFGDPGQPGVMGPGEGPGEGPGKQPSSWFFEQRAFPKGRIDMAAVRRARAGLAVQGAGGGPVVDPANGRGDLVGKRRSGGARVSAQKRTPPGRSAALPAWTQRGPNNIQGRVTDIAVDPGNNQVAYVAAAEGGIFRTTDSGETWTPMFDFEESLSMGAVAIDPLNPNVIYAGTGEVNPGGGSLAYGGAGIYRSSDFGITWTNIGLANSGSIGRIVIHPFNPDVIHVAVMGHLWTGGPERGIYRTTDGGNTWARVLFIDGTTGCVDIIQRPDDPDVLYAAMWQRIRQPEYYDYGGPGCGVYRSTNGGVSWTLVGNGLPVPSADTGRIGLAICDSDPDVMCAVYADRTGFFDALYRTEDGGVSWFQTNDSSLSNAFSSFGWWFGNVRIDPFDPTVIFVIGLRMYRSGDSGQSWSQVGNNMHVDHHAMDFGALPGDNLYCGNDGGVYLSSDGVNFVKTTGDFPITQAYRIATRPWNPLALWIGTQDNGTSQDLSGDGDFDFILGGDGFEPLPHLLDPSRIWAQWQYGGLAYSSNGGGSFQSATGGLSGRFGWNAPHTVDPADPETRYFGSHRVFRNSGDLNWNSISQDLTGGPHLNNNGQVRGTLTAIAVSPLDSDVIWSGSDDGYVHVTLDGGNSWTDVSAGLPARWVTSIRPDANQPGKACLTLSGFRWGESLSQVYRTEDFGQSWTSIGDMIPDAPCNDILVDPADDQRYFVATDFGVYSSEDAGESWARYGAGLPNVVVNDLSFLPSTRELFAGTYGRSIFSIPVPVLTVTAQGQKILDGTVSGGSLSDLFANDNVYYELGPNPTANPVKQKIDLVLQTTSPVASPGVFRFRLQAAMAGGPGGDVIQEVRMLNYNTNSYEVVDARPSTSMDSVVLVTPAGDPGRFVQPATNEMTAIIKWESPQFSGPPFNWDIAIDEAVWLIQ